MPLVISRGLGNTATSGSTAPSVTINSPPAGTKIGATTTLNFTVSWSAPLDFSLLVVKLTLGGVQTWELAYDGSGFSPMYKNSTIIASGSTQTYNLSRTSGWPTDSPVVLAPYIVDVLGGVNP